MVDNPPDGAIDAFDKALGHPVIEVVEELMPPVAQRLDKPDQVPQILEELSCKQLRASVQQRKFAGPATAWKQSAIMS